MATIRAFAAKSANVRRKLRGQPWPLARTVPLNGFGGGEVDGRLKHSCGGLPQTHLKLSRSGGCGIFHHQIAREDVPNVSVCRKVIDRSPSFTSGRERKSNAYGVRVRNIRCVLA